MTDTVFKVVITLFYQNVCTQKELKVVVKQALMSFSDESEDTGKLAVPRPVPENEDAEKILSTACM